MQPKWGAKANKDNRKNFLLLKMLIFCTNSVIVTHSDVILFGTSYLATDREEQYANHFPGQRNSTGYPEKY